MIKRLSRAYTGFAVAILAGLLAVLGAQAFGAGHGRGGGHGYRAPRVQAAARAFKQPRMPRAFAPARSTATGTRAHTNLAQASNSVAHATHAVAANTRRATAGSANVAATGPRSGGRTGLGATTGAGPLTLSPNTYTYGYGKGARPYRAYGYGRGYRNRYYGGRYGYGRSQAYNRAIVGRLRAVHASLARIDHDYQGHRIRAMHSIAMAVRQLSHRSMVYSGVGFAPGMNNANAMGMRRGGGAGAGANGGLGAGGRGRQPMSQGQSDARMSRDLRALQGINMQLSNQGLSTPGHARARGHVQHAIRELGVALSIR
jgi:hypothetical protein